MNEIFIKPIISEKSHQKTKERCYCFSVPTSISKNKAKELIERVFKVNVVAIKSANYKGKIKITKGRKGARKDYKKIIARIKKDQNIEIFEAEKEKKNKDSSKEKK